MTEKNGTIVFIPFLIMMIISIIIMFSGIVLFYLSEGEEPVWAVVAFFGVIGIWGGGMAGLGGAQIPP